MGLYFNLLKVHRYNGYIIDGFTSNNIIRGCWCNKSRLCDLSSNAFHGSMMKRMGFILDKHLSLTIESYINYLYYCDMYISTAFCIMVTTVTSMVKELNSIFRKMLSLKENIHIKFLIFYEWIL